MDRKNTGQGRLHAAWALPEGAEAINDRVWYRDDREVRVIFYGLIPFYSYRRCDKVNHTFAAVQLIEAGLAQQKEVAEACDVQHDRDLRYIPPAQGQRTGDH